MKKQKRNFVVFTKTHLCAWSINEGWLAVMTPSGEKTPPQQQNWQRGEGNKRQQNNNNSKTTSSIEITTTTAKKTQQQHICYPNI